MSLKAKFILAFVLLGILMSGISSVVFYFGFRSLVGESFDAELINEAQEFSECVKFAGGPLRLDLCREWAELEHIREGPHARYMIITDPYFKTLEKTANLGNREFQSYYTFKPSREISIVNLTLDSELFRCAILPVFHDTVLRGYILSGGQFGPIQNEIALFEDTIVGSLFIILSVGILVAYALAQRVSKPLRDIANVVTQISAKNINRRIDVKSREYEIQELTTTLNDLLSRLDESFRQINDFSGNVSHELRTPLTILRGNIEVGLSRERTSQQYSEILSELLEETVRVIRIVDDLLMLAKADANVLQGRLERVSLMSVCLSCVDEAVHICAQKKQTLKTVFNESVEIQGDTNLLTQLIMNLISNASKFSPENSTIYAGISADHDFATIFIRDEGAGISQEELPKIYERFYRVHKDRSRETGGSGLGLPICRMIAKLHGGTIDIQSALGHGTTVTVKIPRLIS